MTAGRLASPEGWQVSVRWLGGSWESRFGGWWSGVRDAGCEALVVEGPRGWMGWWWALVGERIGAGRFGGGCAGGGVGGSDASAGSDGGLVLEGWSGNGSVVAGLVVGVDRGGVDEELTVGSMVVRWVGGGRC
jgi:hypothetical protein